MEKTFNKEITYLSKVFDATLVTDTHDGWEWKPVTKIITFKNLDQSDREQHKFHFRIVTFYTVATKKDDFGSKEGGFTVDTDEAYDMCVEYLNRYASTETTEFASRDREELLNDSGALIHLSMWLAKEKFYPFFLKLMPNMVR